MVFTNLSPNEKQAFFGLLDEYFASRPDVVRALNAPGSSAATQSTANALHSALSSVSAHVEPAWKRQNREQASSGSPVPPQAPTPPELPPSVGRVAAAAAALKWNQPPAPAAAVPRPPPRKLSSYGQENSEDPSEHDTAPPAHARTPSQAEKLVQQKKFGDVDLSSGKNVFNSIRHGTANKTATPPAVAAPVPPAFAPRKNNFGPPPVRRVSSAQQDTAAAKTASPPPPPPPRPRVEEPEEQGDWAEALYDYASEDPGDLEIQSGQRILIVERTSDDWWTGEYQGRKGLVPAAYVKLL